MTAKKTQIVSSHLTGTSPSSSARGVWGADVRGRLVFIAVALLLSAPAFAHNFWLQPKSFQHQQPGPVAMTVEIGHGAERNSWPIPTHRIVRLENHHADGYTDLQPSLHRQGAGSVLQPELSQSGLHLISLDTTHATSTLDAGAFNDYLEKEGIQPALDQRRITRTDDQPGTEIYSRRAKTLVQVGPSQAGDDSVATRVIGQTLEIIPLMNPYADSATLALPVEIRFEGKPLAGALVKLHRQNSESEQAFNQHRTDDEGRATFTLVRNGHWLLTTVWTRPLPDNPEADWDTTFSSLSFGWPDGEPE